MLAYNDNISWSVKNSVTNTERGSLPTAVRKSFHAAPSISTSEILKIRRTSSLLEKPSGKLAPRP